MKQTDTYPIGTPGEKWGDAEKAEWLAKQTVKRSYSEEVLEKLGALQERFEFEQYGALSCAPDRYPLFIAKSRKWNPDKPVILVTGGVHGYETSGVQGAIRFLEDGAEDYSAFFNVFVAPCVSPWGYETINRWNPGAVDPNRSFLEGGASEEALALMHYIGAQDVELTVHIDLHETTDTDNSEFRPALAARDAKPQDNWNIPDGFYLVGDSERPVPEFQQAIIQSVEKVTHIAPPDENGKIIGAPLEQWGVINYDASKLGLCMGMSSATCVTTTEVYPDSPKVDAENCILAQVAAVKGGLDYVSGKP
ncbi:MAG TPA: M14 family metallocarboxypeptidase [Xanthomonadales bacterium]|nr:M14 family metallocarboxypeptidase [Xanthomonadales bacterium]